MRDLLDETVLGAMRQGGGAGPEDQVSCDCIAERFNMWLEHHVSGAWVVSASRREPAQASQPADTSAEHIAADAPHGVTDEQLKKWVAFLWDCGGFEVC